VCAGAVRFPLKMFYTIPSHLPASHRGESCIGILPSSAHVVHP
jgi:hypothetical protein